MSFDEYVMALVLCGHMKYEEVEGMSLAQRVAGIVANLLGEKSEEQVITEVVVARVERFDAWSTAREEGVPDAFVELWQRMNLSGIYGFPLWERPVFFTLLRSLSEVRGPVMTRPLAHSPAHTPCLASESLNRTLTLTLTLTLALIIYFRPARFHRPHPTPPAPLLTPTPPGPLLTPTPPGPLRCAASSSSTPSRAARSPSATGLGHSPSFDRRSCTHWRTTSPLRRRL